MTIPAFHNVAIVTGAAGGLGAIISKRLCQEGFRVVMTDIDAASLENAARTITGEVFTAILDVRHPSSFEHVLQLAIEKWGGVGVLVNNAALTKTTPLFEISPEEFDAVTAIALKGTFVGCQVLGRHMRANGYGRIINIASLAAQNGGAATGAHYAAAKGGIVTLTKVFARELAANGVCVNAISPGPLDLDSVRALLPAEKLDAVTRSIPAAVLGDPDYIAKMVALLADPAAVSAVGATFDINGGLYLR
jgi:3-oxoacyl-[acyl-carrier protein] reductase